MNGRFCVNAFTLMLATLVLPGCSAQRQTDSQESGPRVPTEASAKVKDRLGASTLAILKDVSRVETFRLEPERARPMKPGDMFKPGARFQRWLIRATGKEQGQEFGHKLANALVQQGTYFGQGGKSFEPELAFRVWSGSDSVDVPICYACGNLRVGEAEGAFGGPQGNWKQLVGLAKEAFPADEAIQQLPEAAPSP